MKRILKAILICLTITCFVFAMTACDNGNSSSAKTPGAHYGTKGDVKILKSYVQEEGVTTFTVPDDVDEIKNNAFADNNTIKKIVITSMDIEIGAGAFAKMKALEEIELSFVGAKVGAVNQAKTFAYIFGTESYDEGVAVTQAYNASSETATYYIPKTLKKVTVNPAEDYSLSNYAFNGLGVLTDIVLGDKVVEIGDGAFENCYGLTKLVIPANVTKIGDSAFVGCTGIRGSLGTDESKDSLVFKGTSVAKIGDKAFFGTRLETVVLPEGVEEIGEFAFASTTDITSTKSNDLKEITLPNSLKVIGSYAFLKCANLETVVIGTGVEQISVGAFEYCTALDCTITLGVNVEVWPHAFANLGDSALIISGGYLFDGWAVGSTFNK